MCIFYNFATFAKISSNISIYNGNVQARILHDRCGKASSGLGYEKKRPSGLVLDASGAFTVANLLDVWGRALCLTEAGVMAAAKKHMFKDSSDTALTPHGPISHLRVAICIANVLAQCWHNASI